MFKGFINLLIILLICIIATGISITLSPMFNEYSTSAGVENKELTISLSTSTNDDIIINPTKINIKHESTDKVEMEFSNGYLLKVSIHKDGDLYKTEYLNRLDKNPYSLNLTKDVPYTASIDISQHKLNLPNGNYELIIEPYVDDEFNINPLSLKVEYFKDLDYIPAVNEAPSGKMGLTLYYPDDKYNISELIGITRFVNSNNRPVNTTMEELLKGPVDSTGLNRQAPIGEYNYVKVDSGLTYVDLPSREIIYTDDITGKAAMTSLLKSLSNITGVNRIRFLVDYNRADTFFGGMDISKIVEYRHNNKAYLAYGTQQRYFLVDYDLDTALRDLSFDEKIEKMFEQLKKGLSADLINTVPKDITLLDFSLNNGILTLNFSGDLQNSFNGNDTLQRIMLDSLVLSFTTIDNIEAVQIMTEGMDIDNLAGVDLSLPIYRPKFINPEIN